MKQQNPSLIEDYQSPEYFATECMTQRFLHKHHLTSSVVQGASKVLLDKDLVTNDEGRYYVYDHFMELWLKKSEA